VPFCIDPIPSFAAIISAATSKRSDVPAASFNPAKIMGSAPGKMTFRIKLNRVDPKLIATMIKDLSTCLTPE